MPDFVDFQMDTTDLFILSKLRQQSFGEIVISMVKNKVTLKEFKELKQIKDRVEIGYPLAYVLGQIEFLERVFILNPKVLVPRPETEEWAGDLIQKLKRELTSDSKLNVIELATGSGVIGLSVWLDLSHFIENLLISDLSPEALDLAQENYQNLSSNFSSISKPRFVLSDLFENFNLADLLPFKLKSNNIINLFVANLPYLPNSDNLDLPALAHEPNMALFSGSDGLDLFRKCIEQILDLELKFDILYFELDPRNIFEAKDFVSKIPAFKNYKHSIINDFLGRNRVLQFDIL